MRKFLLAVSLLSAFAAKAQLATFEAQTLVKADTFYVNYSNPLNDAGFDDNNIHFPYVWDTTFGGTWSTGFAFSNKRDSVTSGYFNQYSAKAFTGYNGSDKYAVYWSGYGTPKSVYLTTKQPFNPKGCYVTNSTYAFNSMRDGDFAGKKFGGVSGTDSDWYYIAAHAYRNGALLPDSVQFFLADFRDANSANDYIVKDWRYMDLSRLGTVDSVFFTINSSDVGVFGINTPTYFCLDNFRLELPLGSKPLQMAVAKVYPNPATDRLYVELNDGSIHKASILDASGRLVLNIDPFSSHLEIGLEKLSPGMYFLKLEGPKGEATQRFIRK